MLNDFTGEGSLSGKRCAHWDAKRSIVRGDGKLIAFVELQSAIRKILPAI
jgi:hypothetical protein